MRESAIKFNESNAKYSLWLKQESDNHEKLEARIISTLKRFSESDFNDLVWEQNIKNQRLPRRVYFGSHVGIHPEWQKLAKLYILFESSRMGRLSQSGRYLTHFFKFLVSKKLSLRNVDKGTFRSYQSYLEKLSSRTTQGPLADRSRHNYYNIPLAFFKVMKGHPAVAAIENVEAMVSPYDSRPQRGQYEPINQRVLDVLDGHFSRSDTPLHFRVCYWLMRMYGTRPDDLMSFPLDCAKILKEDEIGTVKTWIGKQGGAYERIDESEEQPYKLVMLNLQEPKQKMLFELIVQQQEMARSLQEYVKEKGFLLTYRHPRVNDGREKVVVMKGALSSYWSVRIAPLFKKGEHPRMKELKHTAISKRAVWGTHTYDALRDLANHRDFKTLDSYNKPAREDHIQLQYRLLEFERKANLDMSFKGESVLDLKYIMPKIMENPFAHQLPGYGFCCDASSCGSHFECLDCNTLVPNPRLREYYYSQAKEYVERADNLALIGHNDLADDRMAVALKFYRLYNRTFDDDLKGLEDIEMIDLEGVEIGEIC